MMMVIAMALAMGMVMVTAMVTTTGMAAAVECSLRQHRMIIRTKVVLSNHGYVE